MRPVIGRHCVAVVPMGWQLVAVQPWQKGAPPLQQARQNAIAGSTSSTAQAPQFWQNSATSQRSPGLPVGVQVPPTQPYPGAQVVATLVVVHWLVQVVVGEQKLPAVVLWH